MYNFYQRAWRYLVLRTYLDTVTNDACDTVNSARLLKEAIGGRNLAKLVFSTIVKIGAGVGIIRLLLMI